MKQVDFQLIDASSFASGDCSPQNNQSEHLTIGNLVFETNDSESPFVPAEEYYNSVLATKQSALPISCILEKKQKGIIEAFYSQKRCHYNSSQELTKKVSTMNGEQQYVLQHYVNTVQNASNTRVSMHMQHDNSCSDSGSHSSRGSYSTSSGFELEAKESTFAYFIEKELGSFSNNAGLNGKSQIFSYTIIQCIEDELEPFILRKGISEAYVSILGSNKNHYQQMMMRIATYEPRSTEIRRQANISLLKTHLQCYEAGKFTAQDAASSYQQISNSQAPYPNLPILPISPFSTYGQSQVETLERTLLNCSITTTVIPCILSNGTLLGFIQFESYAFQAPVVKQLMADRRVNKMQIPNFWNQQEYNIKSELFIQKMECYNN